MVRLIDADKLESSLNKTVDAAIKWHEDCLGEIMQNRSEAAIMAFNECILRLKEQPTVDAVEVTRCKDCEYWRGEGKYCDYDMSGLSDDYCSWGVRRAKDEDSKKG